jgi:hypothetical protein
MKNFISRSQLQILIQNSLGEEGGSANWWITERDVTAEQHQAFGLANLFGGPEDAELGYISIAEIIAAGGEIDLHFEPTTVRALKTLQAA